LIDVARARADTPGCEHVLHLNNAGASLMPNPVLDAVAGHLRLEAEIGGYEAAERREEDWEHSYSAIAQLINAAPDEIAIGALLQHRGGDRPHGRRAARTSHPRARA
jgi:selenocysteine lyase/cysteine desulfurase